MAAIGSDIARAKVLLSRGELVAIPTETVYGLAANALEPQAVAKIFTAKDRPTFDPLIVHVSSFDQVEKYTSALPEKAKVLARHFWPGPLTLVLPKNPIIPDIVTSGLDTVGIRCPNHEITHRLLQEIDFPLAAPSANPFGYVSPTTAQHVNDQLGDKINYILDGGACAVGLESTIVGFEGDQVVIYRRGGVNEDEIEKSIGKVIIKVSSSSNPLSPGQLEVHYAPKKKIVLGEIEQLQQRFESSRVAVLRFQHNGQSKENEFALSSSGDLEEAARNLFATLRQLDKLDVDVILAERVPEKGIGRAINDRLQRAVYK